MQDVADAAGVSVGTVSNVLNHPAKVSPATAQRVREAISRLGFVRNDAARSLVSGTTNSVGMVLADIENSLFIDMAHGAQDAARAIGQNLLLANTACDMTLQDEYLDLFDESRMTGVLLAPMEDSSAGIARIRSHGRQVVLLNYAPRPGTCCSVLVNNEHVGYLAARHLIDTGRKRLAYVVAHDDYQPVRDRRRGVRAAVEEAGPDVTLEEIDSVGLTKSHGHVVGRDLARRAPGDLPDGLIAVTDELANAVIHELHTVAGIRVPDQVAVVGCENNRAAGAAAVPLTAVDMPGRMMGQEAIRLLMDEVASGDRHRHATVVLEPELIVRASAPS
ncbi:LacI family transcriptional regulator [Streptomyces sp. IBSBF 2953]|uniref:LacI family DNA-binding transcriptional regulator n=1 Tax=Streptomyces TaxID=1883 RepID=UPI002119EE21|nr:LacI family DNA-binding transcriptional regulator [Streptomyces scabiei]MCQ9179636.1 LacI family transcriptional regulator [Streptomyces hayashii]MDX3115886.1 LacI family DNA-binding transcriptional regulator [Streptomyces scabiei]